MRATSPPSLAGAAARVAVGSTTLGAALEASARFAVTGEGALATRTLTPETAAARALLERPAAPAVRALLRGLLGAADARAGQQVLHGVSLSSEPERFVANRMVSNLRAGTLAAPTDGASVARLAAAARADLAAVAPAGVEAHRVHASYTRGHLDIGPEASRVIAASLRAGEGEPTAGMSQARRAVAYVLAHELGHAGSSLAGGARVDAREEGVAEVLARWPGSVDEVARHLGWHDAVDGRGLAVEAEVADGANQALRSVLAAGYDEPVAAVRAELREHGIDLSAPAQRSAAEAFLRGSVAP
jgi:hypothetical protein